MDASVQFPKYDSYKDSGVEWLGVIPEHWDKPCERESKKCVRKK